MNQVSKKKIILFSLFFLKKKKDDSSYKTETRDSETFRSFFAAVLSWWRDVAFNNEQDLVRK